MSERRSTNRQRAGVQWLRIGLLFVLLYVFLVSIKLMESGIKILGAGATEGLFAGITNPFAGLAVGILATVLVQSSSVTTATIVALVGAGELPLPLAVPMVMGANIGTTITNTLVSIGHVRRSGEFRRAFAAATMHDCFNLLAVGVLFPIEIATGFLARIATSVAGAVSPGEGGSTYKSPIKAAVSDGAGVVKGFFLDVLGLQGALSGFVVLGVGIVLVFVALTVITKTMRKVIASGAERALNAVLARSGVFAIGLGVILTMAVQSSSITTSLLVPLCGAGVLSLENAFPVMLGANIGTTITAFLASLATDANGLAIALVHGMFNGIAVLAVFPIRAIRRIPVRMARGLAIRAVRQKAWVGAYVITVFVLLPLAGILLFR